MKLEPDYIKAIVEAKAQQFTLIDNKYVAYKLFAELDNQMDSYELVDRKLEFPLCNLYFINCLSILSCYLLEVPGFYLDFNPFYIKIRRFEALNIVSFSQAQFIHQDKYLNIIHSNDGATLVSPNNLKRVIKPEMVRKSSTRD